MRRSHCASSGREECDGGRKARAGHPFEPPDRSPTGSPASATPFSLCYASSPSTVREEGAQRRAKERSRREEAQQTIRRGLPRTGAAGQEPRGTTAPRDSPGNPPDSPAFQRERPTGPAPRTRETHSDTSITIFPCAAERHRAPGGRCSPVFAPDCAARGWIPGGSGGILYTCSTFVAPRPLPHRRVRGTGAPRTGPPVSTTSSKRARGDWRPWPPAGRWRRSSSG